MRDTLKLHVPPVRRSVIQQKNRTAAVDKEVLQRKDLSSEAERIAGEKFKFRKRIKHDTLWIEGLDRSRIC